MPTCTSKGCDRPTRGRRFNTRDNGKIYYEKRCRSCEHSLRRHGLTTPERLLLKGGGEEGPSGAPGLHEKDKTDV